MAVEGLRSMWPAQAEKSQGGRAWVPVTSARLAHKGHDLAGGQREGEVSEHLEAGAAGVTGRTKTPSVRPGSSSLMPRSLQRLTVYPRGFI